ncbi:MAG: ribonucleoside triphosphate reductase [Candidatus Aenigmatarchaeota archaeon]
MKKERYLDVVKTTEGFLKKTDWRTKENANITFSFSNVFFRLAGEVISKYILTRIYPKEISKAHVEGDIHIHNLYMGIVPYCMGWDLSYILLRGLSGIGGRLSTRPPKHLNVALHQLVNFVGIIQNEAAGAQAFNSFDTFMAPFVRSDKLNYKQVKQSIQEFIYGLNVTARWGGQSPFSNITLDWSVPEDLRERKSIVGGKELKETYSDYQDEMDMINKAFIEVMLEESNEGRIFTFPIPTYNITKNWDWDSENSDLLFEMTAKLGLPYFANFINSDLKPSDIRSLCCRLRLDLTQLQRNITGGLFGSSVNTGSIGVVTINMPRIGYLSRNESQFFERLSEAMETAKKSLEIKRKIVTKNMENGLLPYTKFYLGSLENHFSTIGLIGMNEACLNFLGLSIAHPEGKKFAIKTLEFMLKKLVEFQKETGNLYNLEATPAEGTSYNLALKDKKKYPKIITAGKEVPYYTSSTQLPVNFTDDIIFAIKHQEDIQVLYTGGTVLHIFLGERMSSGDACKSLLKKIFSNTRLPYITITPTYSICPNHGYLKGEQFKCPICNSSCDVYSRVVGYYRPVQNWNEGKQEEFKQRKEFSEKIALEKSFN